MTIYSPQLRGEIQLFFSDAEEQLISVSLLIVSLDCLFTSRIIVINSVCDIMLYSETFSYRGVHLRVQFPVLDTPPYGSLWCT